MAAFLLADKILLSMLAPLRRHEYFIRICRGSSVVGVPVKPGWGATALPAGLGRRRKLFKERDNFIRELFDGGRWLSVGGREPGDGASLVLVCGFGHPRGHGERVK